MTARHSLSMIAVVISLEAELGYCRLQFHIAEMGNFALVAPVTLTLTR